MAIAIASPIAAQAFFLPADLGERFCLFHAAAPGRPARGAVLYVHPFAEELNKSRRMTALQSRALAAAGFHVLQIDLYGCGDSSGDFADARWATWKHDLRLALLWLAGHAGGPYTVWGLRLGALLALDLANESPLSLQQLILWQPVLRGKNSIDQFLRLELANQLLTTQDDASSAERPMLTARQRLRTDGSVEVAGYRLSSELTDAIDRLDAATLACTTPLSWFEISPRAQLPAATVEQARRWRAAGIPLSLHAIAGPPFWSSAEIGTCAPLLEATTRAAIAPAPIRVEATETA